MEDSTFELRSRYFIERVTDFGDLTGTWKICNTPPVNYVEYIAEMVSLDGIWYYHNKYKGGPAGFASSYAKMPLTKEEFDTNIKPHVVNMKKDENEMKDERKAAGWIVELVAKTIKEELSKQKFKDENSELLGKLVLELGFDATKAMLYKMAGMDLTKEVKPEADYKFEINDRVMKNKGDYNLEGIVVGRFKMLNGAVRYNIEHTAVPKGSFVHIYSDTQLELVKKGT